MFPQASLKEKWKLGLNLELWQEGQRQRDTIKDPHILSAAAIALIKPGRWKLA